MTTKRLSIAFVTYSFGRQFGGAEAYGVEVIRELAKKHSVEILTCQTDTELEKKFIIRPIQVSKKWPGWIRAYLFAKKAAALTKTNSYDIVYSHMNGWNGDVDVLHVRSVRYRHLYMVKSNLKKSLKLCSPRLLMYLWLEKQRVHLNNNRKTIVVSELLKSQLQQAYSTDYDFEVITPGVHLPAKLTPVERLDLREKNGYKPTDKVCIQVALNPLSKGLDVILEALALLPESIKLLVVGSPPDLSEQLIPKLKDLRLEARVKLIPKTEDITQYYQISDLCLHPTLSDSFGMAPLEAMSYGLPVIMSNAQYCGFAYYAQHLKNTYLLDNPKDIHQLKSAIIALTTDQNSSENIARAGFELSKCFSWQEIATRYEKIFFELFKYK